MAFKSGKQPLCRHCGGKIGKRTEIVYFGRSEREVERNQGRSEQPKNKAEAQRYVNGEIVSVRYSHLASINYRDQGSTHVTVPRYVDTATVWDGETYDDEFFCSNRHAVEFGYASARGGYVMDAWRVATHHAAA